MPATVSEDSIPYLRPYDVFEYLPPETDRISRHRTKNSEDYLISADDILQTRSGRNLGPVTLADEYLAKFAVSDDMIRIRIENEHERYYSFAFLRSVMGQRILRGELGGSVISHISPDHVSGIAVPFIDSIEVQVVSLVRKAVSLRGSARSVLHSAVGKVNANFPVLGSKSMSSWSAHSQALKSRFDAAFHSRAVCDVRALLEDGVALEDAADVVKPAGRHKMVYVDPGHGTPLLSGRQILQADVVAAKHLSKRSAQAAGGFELQPKSVVFQADGRAGEGLGYPAMVTNDRQGWLASGHVGRLLPSSTVEPGWLWAAFASDIVQIQIAALCCGSVVDALYPNDLKRVLLPPRRLVDSSAVEQAWDTMAEAGRLFDQASRLIDEVLDESDVIT
ncbi:hypothetical protein [Nocardia jiangsuensis]|uniref:Type I restriction enzyme S subunit n=1 Tax=Nocardia jiangsuensis TaxID=1691563 RepID=A0ABV8DLH0_9NOCA